MCHEPLFFTNTCLWKIGSSTTKIHSKYNLSMFGEGDSRGNIYCAIHIKSFECRMIYWLHIAGRASSGRYSSTPSHSRQGTSSPVVWVKKKGKVALPIEHCIGLQLDLVLHRIGTNDGPRWPGNALCHPHPHWYFRSKNTLLRVRIWTMKLSPLLLIVACLSFAAVSQGSYLRSTLVVEPEAEDASGPEARLLAKHYYV